MDKRIKKSLSIINRVIKNRAVGIIYNIPAYDEAMLSNKLLDEKKAVVVKGTDAYTAPMLIFRLGSKLNTKHLQFHMLPALLNEKTIAITGADIFTPSFSRVIDDSFRYKFAILLLMHAGASVNEFRKLRAYHHVLTIEQDYNQL